MCPGQGGNGASAHGECRALRSWLVVLVVVLFLVAFGLLLTSSSSERRWPAPETQLEVTVYGHEVSTPRGPSSTQAQVPSVMMDLFRRGPHEQFPAEIVRSLTPLAIDQLHHRRWKARAVEHLHLLTFSVPAPLAGEALHSAQLRLSLTFLHGNLTPATDVDCIVRVYLDSIEPLLSMEVQNQFPERTVSLNCTDVINRFHKLQKTKGGQLQLMVGVTVAIELEVHPLLTGDHVDNLPLLLLLYSPSDDHSKSAVSVTQGRWRRSTEDDYEEETNEVWPGVHVSRARGRRPRNFCRRRPLYVEFSDIHYDSWIVAPNGYQAYQCVGRCVYPLSDHLSPTKHAIIQTLVHGVHPSKGGRACCVPTALDSISILYLDSQGVLTYRLSYKDMVVTECGCR